MSEATFPPGTVYTETTIHAAPEAFLQDAPYQIAIVEAEDGHHLTIRILGPKDGGEAVAIGDRVVYAESRNGIPFYRKTE